MFHISEYITCLKDDNDDVSLMRGQAVRESGLLEAKAQAAITKRTLKTAEPTIVPMPTSLTAMKTPITVG